MSQVQWSEPPPDGRTSHAQVAETLRSRPGEWALVSESAAPSLASHIRSGRTPAWQPAGHFETTSRGIPGTKPARVKVWARYVGASGD